MKKKRLTSLTKSDLVVRSVWEHWTEADVEHVSPSGETEINDLNNKGYIVLTDFTLNNGAKVDGLLFSTRPKWN